MRTVLLFTLALYFSFLPKEAAAQPFVTNEPLAYLDYIGEQRMAAGQLFEELSQIFLNQNTPEQADAERKRIALRMELHVQRIRNMADFEGDGQLRTEAIAVFEGYKSLLTGEYGRKMAEMSSRSSSIADLEAFYAIQIKGEQQHEALFNRINAAEVAFATRHGVQMMDEPAGMSDPIGEANDYCRTIYWEYLRLAKENEAWWAAYNADDINGMETARSQLDLALRNSGIPAAEPVLGDTKVKAAGLALHQLLETMVREDFPAMEAVIANPASTKADIDDLNARVGRYNEQWIQLNENFNEANSELKKAARTMAAE